KQLAAIVDPAIAAVLAETAAGSPAGGPKGAESDWLATRAATILTAMKKPASKEVAAVLSRLVDDAGRRLDVRIRAARALGAAADASSQIDAGKSIASIRSLAVAGLQGDLAIVDRRRLEEEHRSMSAGGQPGSAAASDARTPVQACRRAAWRLNALADALLTEGDGPRGLALLAGDAKEAAATLASDLRQAGRSLDENPTEQSLETALAVLAPQAAAGREGATKPPAERPAPAEPKPAETPASPFEPNPFGN
ncbi:MAG: hypothetical protein EBZ59_08345, partial [Planctomycetia bacterium]|nr:hypothetical protein [Planctomycetia bacterium]